MLRVVTKDLKVRVKINNCSGNDIIVTICKLYEVLLEQGFKKEDIDRYLCELLDIKGGKNAKNSSRKW